VEEFSRWISTSVSMIVSVERFETEDSVVVRGCLLVLAVSRWIISTNGNVFSTKEPPIKYVYVETFCRRRDCGETFSR
jgi:hypothetical protein